MQAVVNSSDKGVDRLQRNMTVVGDMTALLVSEVGCRRSECSSNRYPPTVNGHEHPQRFYARSR